MSKLIELGRVRRETCGSNFSEDSSDLDQKGLTRKCDRIDPLKTGVFLYESQVDKVKASNYKNCVIVG